MVTIHNLRYEKPQYDYDVRVDRTTPLGNPFAMKDKSDEERSRVCNEYYGYLQFKYAHNDRKIVTMLKRLDKINKKFGKVRLFCWCHPQQCHAETIKKYLDRSIPVGEL